MMEKMMRGPMDIVDMDISLFVLIFVKDNEHYI